MRRAKGLTIQQLQHDEASALLLKYTHERTYRLREALDAGSEPAQDQAQPNDQNTASAPEPEPSA